MPIKYLKGDATNPVDGKTKIIAHVCNDIGAWGKGFVLAISKKWKQPETAYRNWYKNKEGDVTPGIQFQKIEGVGKNPDEKQFQLGNVQFAKVADDIWVANMIGQRDIKAGKNGVPPIRYASVTECLERVAAFAGRYFCSVHMPRIGCGLAGGEWAEIERIINAELIAHDIETTVYDL